MNQWRKGIVGWRCSRTLYLSVPFTWLLDDAAALARHHKTKGGKVIAGGPAVALCGAPWASETPANTPFDVLAMHNPCATFTTRGCPNKCRFCAVPKIEGDFVEMDTWKPAPIVCDNNLLAASKRHFSKVINSLKCFPLVDFNQGLDARLFTSWHAGCLAALNKVIVRFAFDHIDCEFAVADAIGAARRAGLTDFRVYVLVGYDDTPEDALYRLEKVREWGAMPLPMRFQPLDAREKNEYVDPNWTEYELSKMCRYFFRLNHLGHIPYEQYVHGGETPLFAEAVKL